MSHLFRYYSIILFVCKTFFISYISIKLCYYYYFFREYDKHSALESTEYPLLQHFKVLPEDPLASSRVFLSSQIFNDRVNICR